MSINNSHQRFIFLQNVLKDKKGIGYTESANKIGLTVSKIRNIRSNKSKANGQMCDKLIKEYPYLEKVTFPDDDPPSMANVPETLRLLAEFEARIKYLELENQRLRQEKDLDRKSIEYNQDTINGLLSTLKQVTKMIEQEQQQRESNDKPTMIDR